MSAVPAVAPDAAIVLGIASTAMPFARTREEAAERWLRVLRLNGQAGAALQALGVGEGALQAHAEVGDCEQAGSPASDRRETPSDAVGQVVEHAAQIARERGASGITTADVLMAVMRVYGTDFDRVLRAHGVDRNELIERLEADALDRAGG
jgi:ATP-dependent Clp protease ATP-binding subunit ClpA